METGGFLSCLGKKGTERSRPGSARTQFVHRFVESAAGSSVTLPIRAPYQGSPLGELASAARLRGDIRTIVNVQNIDTAAKSPMTCVMGRKRKDSGAAFG